MHVFCHRDLLQIVKRNEYTYLYIKVKNKKGNKKKKEKNNIQNILGIILGICYDTQHSPSI